MGGFRRFSAIGAVVVLYAAGLMTVAPAAAACGSVDVQTEDDACASVLAVSVLGDAWSHGDCNDLVGCFTVSGTGNATNDGGREGCGGPMQVSVINCVAVSGTGDATNRGGARSCGAWTVAACIAVSVTGDARHENTDPGWGGREHCGYWWSVSIACWSISVRGDATYHDSYATCETIGSCVAVSVLGSADAEGKGRCYGVVCGTCIAIIYPRPTNCGNH